MIRAIYIVVLISCQLLGNDKVESFVSFEYWISEEFKLFNVEDEYYLSITDTNTAEAYLFREPNELLEGFPMYGKTTGIAEDMNLDGKINFITAGESGTLYNYAVE